MIYLCYPITSICFPNLFLKFYIHLHVYKYRVFSLSARGDLSVRSAFSFIADTVNDLLRQTVKIVDNDNIIDLFRNIIEFKCSAFQAVFHRATARRVHVR